MKYDLKQEGPGIVWFTHDRVLAKNMLDHMGRIIPTNPEPIELSEPFQGKFLVTGVEWVEGSDVYPYTTNFLAAIIFRQVF